MTRKEEVWKKEREGGFSSLPRQRTQAVLKGPGGEDSRLLVKKPAQVPTQAGQAVQKQKPAVESRSRRQASSVPYAAGADRSGTEMPYAAALQAGTPARRPTATRSLSGAETGPGRSKDLSRRREQAAQVQRRYEVGSPPREGGRTGFSRYVRPPSLEELRPWGTVQEELNAAQRRYSAAYGQALEALDRAEQGGGREFSEAGRRYTQAFALLDEVNKLKKELEKIEAAQRRYLISHEGYREPSLWDLTVGSVKKGYDTSRYGQESYKAMLGEENEKEKYERLLESEEYKFLPSGWLEEGVSGASGLAGQWTRQVMDPRTLGMGLTMAGSAAVLGNAGPQALAPEEIVTVPAAFAAGIKGGAALSNFEIEAGLAYNELVENGISAETAKKIALGIGGVNAGLELVQLGELFRSYRVLKNSGAGGTVLQKVGQELLDRGVSIGSEVLQETAQEGVTIGGVQLGSRLEKGRAAYTPEEVRQRLKETAGNAALSFGLLELPAAGMHLAEGRGQAPSVKWVSDDVADSMLGDQRSLDFLRRWGGLELTREMSVDQKRAEVRRAIGETLQTKRVADPGELGEYWMERPENADKPATPFIELSTEDIPHSGEELPKVGNPLRAETVKRAQKRLGLDERSAVYIPVSNVRRDGKEYVLKVTKHSLSKMLSPSSGGSVPLESIVVLDNIERIVNNGVWFDGEGDRKGRQQIAGYDHLKTTVYIDKAHYLIDIRVRLVDHGPGKEMDNVLYYFSPEILSIEKISMEQY